jgi:hypothetical protein
LNKTLHKKGLAKWLKVYVGPEFKPQYCKKKKIVQPSPLSNFRKFPPKKPLLLIGSFRPWQPLIYIESL